MRDPASDRRSLNFSIALIHLGGIALAVVIFALFSHFLVRHHLEDGLRKRLRTAASTLERIIADQTTELERDVRLTQLDASLGTTFRHACNREERDAEQNLLHKMNALAITTSVGLVEAFTPDRRLLYRTASADTCGAPMDVWGLEDSLAGDNVLVLNTEDDLLAVRAMGPVWDGGEIVGAVAFIMRVDEVFLRSISTLVNGEIFLANGPTVTASTLPPGGKAFPVDPGTLGLVAGVREGTFGPPVSLRDVLYETYYFPLKIANRTVVAVGAMERTSLDRALATTTWSIAFWGIMVVIIGMLTATVFARRFVRPLRALQSAAGRIAGGDYTVRLDDTEALEFSAVAVAFNEMTGKLRETIEELDQAKNRAELLFKFTPSAIFTVDLSRRITSWNDAARELTGFTAEEMLGSECLLFADTPCRDGCGLYDQDIPKPVMGKKCVIRRKDGARRVISKNVDVLRDSRGTVVGGIESFIDVTEQQHAEHLLRTAKNAAEEASRAKNDFLASVSHDVRTPINGILGMANLLGNTSLDNEQREILRMMRASADSLRHLMEGVLDFSRIEAGKLDLVRAPLGLRSVLDAVLQPLRIRAREKGLSLEWGVRPSVPDDLVGDEGKLRQVLTNLVDNAVKFSSEGGVEVNVSPGETGGSRVKLVFSVRDTGMGIPATEQSAIFEPFTQGEHARGPKHGGAGLGLAICRRLVHLMGGDISLRSGPGKGSEFVFTAVFDLPGDAARERSSHDADHSAAGCTAGRSGEHRPANVLLVEDNEINQALVDRILAHHGYPVVLAHDGEEALAMLQRERFDVILMDIQMPGMDGFETTRRIRASEERAGERIPIIAMTAHAMGGDRERCLDAGMDDYISKPFHADDLCEKIEHWTQRSSGVQRPATPPSGGMPSAPRRAMVGDGASIDSAGALSLLDGDRKMYAKLLAIFLEDGARRLESFRSGIAEWDPSILEREAHSLKSMAATIGASGLARRAEDLEKAAHDGDNGRVRNLFAGLEVCFGSVSTEARVLKDRIEGSPG